MRMSICPFSAARRRRKNFNSFFPEPFYYRRIGLAVRHEPVYGLRIADIQKAFFFKLVAVGDNDRFVGPLHHHALHHDLFRMQRADSCFRADAVDR